MVGTPPPSAGFSLSLRNPKLLPTPGHSHHLPPAPSTWSPPPPYQHTLSTLPHPPGLSLDIFLKALLSTTKPQGAPLDSLVARHPAFFLQEAYPSCEGRNVFGTFSPQDGQLCEGLPPPGLRQCLSRNALPCQSSTSGPSLALCPGSGA